MDDITNRAEREERSYGDTMIIVSLLCLRHETTQHFRTTLCAPSLKKPKWKFSAYAHEVNADESGEVYKRIFKKIVKKKDQSQSGFSTPACLHIPMTVRLF
jgi:hypothetical protein